MQVYLGIYDLLLPPGIKELLIKEIRIQVANSNCKSYINLILFSLQVPPFASVDSPYIRQKKWPTFQQLWSLIVRDRSMNSPFITKMECFAITLMKKLTDL